jgi:hypothetical protein
LPKTYRIINKNINIISARANFQHINQNNMYVWKELAFKKTVMDFYTNQYNIQNIISIGDADYEYKALIKLYDITNTKKKYLKAIKFLGAPSLDNTITQINILNNNIADICNHQMHLDKTFKLV